MTMRFLLPNIPSRTRFVAYAAWPAFGIVVLVLGPACLPPAPASWGSRSSPRAGSSSPARHYRNKPVDLGFEDWRPASMTEFSRILSNLERTRKAKLPLIYRAGCGVSILAALLIVALITMARGAPGRVALHRGGRGSLLPPSADRARPALEPH